MKNIINKFVLWYLDDKVIWNVYSGSGHVLSKKEDYKLVSWKEQKFIAKKGDYLAINNEGNIVALSKEPSLQERKYYIIL